MPKTDDGVDGFVEDATAESLTTLRDALAETVLELRMPEVDIPAVTVDYDEPFALACELFTMRTALDGTAIQINATGIRAAAAGAVESWATGTGSPAERTIILNQPYLFFVFDEPTGAVLFHGRYVGAQHTTVRSRPRRTRCARSPGYATTRARARHRSERSGASQCACGSCCP